jgi:hypothetical protein
MTRYAAGNKGPMLPAAGPRGAGVKPGPTLSPRGAVTGGGRPAPMSTGPSLSPRGAMTGGARPAPTRPMKKGGAVAKKAAPKKR